LPSIFISIEDAKQKAEHDKMMKLADEKKKEVRRQIAKLRRQFKSILDQNEGLPVHLQLKKEVRQNCGGGDKMSNKLHVSVYWTRMKNCLSTYN
jgi:hypothetical protein